MSFVYSIYILKIKLTTDGNKSTNIYTGLYYEMAKHMHQPKRHARARLMQIVCQT